MSQLVEQPIPQGKYRPAVRNADLIFTSGMTPRRGGVLVHSGRIRAADALDVHRDAVRLATLNALTAAQSCVRDGERIVIILQLTVFLNAEQDFVAHSKLADVASETLMEHLGAECIGSRTAIGVATLPANAPVEITLIAKVV